MKINWNRIAQFFEQASGLPPKHQTEKAQTKTIQTAADFKALLLSFDHSDQRENALQILTLVRDEATRRSELRKDESYTSWLNAVVSDEQAVAQIMRICDYVAGYDVRTAGKFYYDEFLWGTFSNVYCEEDIQKAAHLIDYAEKAMAQGEPEIAVDMYDMLYHCGLEEIFVPKERAGFRTQYAKALIAFIDDDFRAARNHLENEAGVGGPNPEYELPYYQARAYLAAQELKNKGEFVPSQMFRSPFVENQKDEDLYPVLRLKGNHDVRVVLGPQYSPR